MVGLEVEELDEGKSQITHGETVAETAKHQDWECDEKLMKLTKGGKALYMHCLPADIFGVSCSRGEVSAGVFEKYKWETYLQASYKPFIIAAMMLFGQFGPKAGSKI